MFKILHISDIHCQYSYLEYILEYAESENFNLIVVSGDLECDFVAEALANAKTRIYAVPGNLDDSYIVDLMDEYGINIKGEIVKAENYYIIGYSSDIHEKIELEKPDMSKTIVIAHYSPYGTKTDIAYNGAHIGKKYLRRFIEKYQPLLLLCGHVHESRGVDEIGKTKIVNPGPLAEGYYATIILPDLHIELRKIEGI